MFSRIALFLATNLAVLVLASIVMSILGVNPNQMSGLLVMAAIFGFGGSLISLLLSKTMALRATGAQVIEQPRNEAEQWLLATVQRQAQGAGIGMPQVAIYDAPGVGRWPAAIARPRCAAVRSPAHRSRAGPWSWTAATRSASRRNRKWPP